MLEPADLQFGAYGPYSSRYQDRYFGEAGPLAQARGVFLTGCDLPAGWRQQRQFCVLETGFGLGFNFLACWQAWLEDPHRPDILHFVSVERHPARLPDLHRAHACEPSLAALAAQLRLALPLPVEGCHRLLFSAGRVQLTLLYGDGPCALHELQLSADAVFLDGFAPDRNPALWSAEVMQAVGRLCRSEARLASWTANGEVRRQLRAAGFAVQRGPGFRSKRETTLAVRLAGPSPQRAVAGAAHVPAAAAPLFPAAAARRSAIIVGAGLAGCTLAASLAREGWQLELIDAAAAPASAASGNPAGVVRPLFSRDDNPVSRLTRAAFLHAVRQWNAHAGQPAWRDWHPVGVLHMAHDGPQWAQWQAAQEGLGWPAEYMQLLDRAAASRQCGVALPHGGLLFPGGGWANPASLCRQSLAAAGAALRCHWERSVAEVRALPAGSGWVAVDAAGAVIAAADCVVICSGAGWSDAQGMPQGAPFLATPWRPLQALRGEITQIRSAALDRLDSVLCGEGYLCNSPDGSLSLGATYDRSGDARCSEAGRAENLARLAHFTGIDRDAVQIQGGRVAWRSIAADRLPIVGADPERSGLWHLRGFASRGLVWSMLMADTLAALMQGSPLPLERSLYGMLHPARSVLKERKHA